ncbi:hypothetical protein EJ08DRAFT_657509 [Tothia fuscella]|uniref:Uncharacterized protein n=1 Tax=Tothia fuscella TaxID=1048955 RepID=A0A9P4NZ24_9PEZI|nr:hypothetical protein EJ08DRAFT_657509 [Tothia fuscella]
MGLIAQGVMNQRITDYADNVRNRVLRGLGEKAGAKLTGWHSIQSSTRCRCSSFQPFSVIYGFAIFRICASCAKYDSIANGQTHRRGLVPPAPIGAVTVPVPVKPTLRLRTGNLAFSKHATVPGSTGRAMWSMSQASWTQSSQRHLLRRALLMPPHKPQPTSQSNADRPSFTPTADTISNIFECWHFNPAFRAHRFATRLIVRPLRRVVGLFLLCALGCLFLSWLVQVGPIAITTFSKSIARAAEHFEQASLWFLGLGMSSTESGASPMDSHGTPVSIRTPVEKKTDCSKHAVVFPGPGQHLMAADCPCAIRYPEEINTTRWASVASAMSLGSKYSLGDRLAIQAAFAVDGSPVGLGSPFEKHYAFGKTSERFLPLHHSRSAIVHSKIRRRRTEYRAPALSKCGHFWLASSTRITANNGPLTVTLVYIAMAPQAFSSRLLRLLDTTATMSGKFSAANVVEVIWLME